MSHPIAALIADVPRYYCGKHGYEDHPQGKLVLVSDILAALEAAPDPDLVGVLEEAKWRPIETAPRGGEWFLARTGYGTTRSVHFADEYDRFPISHDGVVWSTAPVEWMPLSAVPSLIALATAQAAQIAGLTKERDEHRANWDRAFNRNAALDEENATLRAEVERLREKIRDWEIRIEDCEWSANTSLTEGIRAEMRAALEGKHE